MSVLPITPLKAELKPIKALPSPPIKAIDGLNTLLIIWSELANNCTTGISAADNILANPLNKAITCLTVSIKGATKGVIAMIILLKPSPINLKVFKVSAENVSPPARP